MEAEIRNLTYVKLKKKIYYTQLKKKTGELEDRPEGITYLDCSTVQ